MTESQIREIVRLRFARKQYKAIARTVGCTLDQVIHYCRVNHTPKIVSAGGFTGQARKERQRLKRLEKARAVRESERQVKALAAAKAALAREIELAKAERGKAPRFRSGDTGTRRPGK